LPPIALTLWRTLLALGIGTAGGAVFMLLDLPLSWMIGAMTMTTIASLCGLRIAIPHPLREPNIFALGIMLGSAFTPSLAAQVGQWLPSLLVLPLYVPLVGSLIYLYLRRVAGFPPNTAFFAATPGGLSEMIVLGDRMGGDLREIALVHGVRVLLIVLTIPFLARLFGISVPSLPPAVATLMPAREVLIVLASGGLFLGLARLVRLPASILIGPMLGSALVYLTGLATVPPPRLLLVIAQIVMGASVGARFSGMKLWRVLRTMLLGIGSTMVMLLVTLAFAFALHLATGRPLLPLALAFIPGGLPEMSMTALAIGVDPAFVSTHHIGRIAIVVFFAPLLFRLVQPRILPRGP
jgi:uncharacterized protein